MANGSGSNINIMPDWLATLLQLAPGIGAKVQTERNAMINALNLAIPGIPSVDIINQVMSVIATVQAADNSSITVDPNKTAYWVQVVCSVLGGTGNIVASQVPGVIAQAESIADTVITHMQTRGMI